MSPHSLYLSGDIKRLPHIAREFLLWADGVNLIAFMAPMGAGKTTFIKAIARELGVNEPVSSPTFSIVNQYLTANNQTIYHFDFYRLNSIKEAMDIGIEEYFDSGNLCLMEWCENIEPLLKNEKYIRVEIKIDGDDRIFRFEKINY